MDREDESADNLEVQSSESKDSRMKTGEDVVELSDENTNSNVFKEHQTADRLPTAELDVPPDAPSADASGNHSPELFSGKNGEDKRTNLDIVRKDGEITPYDDVLSLLKNGPLASGNAINFPKPLRAVGGQDARVQNSHRDRKESPVPRNEIGKGKKISFTERGLKDRYRSMAKSSVQEFAENGAFEKRYAASRLGPYHNLSVPNSGDFSLKYGSGLKPGTQRQGLSYLPNFSQASEAKNIGQTVSSIGEIGIEKQNIQLSGFGVKERHVGSIGPTPSPPKLAWTPIRTTPASRFHSSTGTKRKADYSEGTSTPGLTSGKFAITELDAQRRTRTTSNIGGSTGRRSWRAGRTPFQAITSGRGFRKSSVKFGGDSNINLTPVPLIGMTTAAESQNEIEQISKSHEVTDTAEKVLKALKDIDSTLKPQADKRKSVDVDHLPAPPTESLGAGLPNHVELAKDSHPNKAKASENEQPVQRKRPRVTFAELVPPLPAEPSPIGKALFDGGNHEAVVEEKEQKDNDIATPTLKSKNNEIFIQQKALNKDDVASCENQTPLESMEAGKSQNASVPKFSFGSKSNFKHLNERIKSIVQGAGECYEPLPSFAFGKKLADQKKMETKETEAINSTQKKPPEAIDLSPIVQHPSIITDKANKDAEEAAKSPLPPSPEDKEEKYQHAVKDLEVQKFPTEVKGVQRPVSAKIFESAANGKKETLGWDSAFLQKNKIAMAEATKKVDQEIKNASGGASPSEQLDFGSLPASQPSFLFGASEADKKPVDSFEGASATVAAVPQFLSSSSPALFSFGKTGNGLEKVGTNPQGEVISPSLGENKAVAAGKSEATKSEASGWGADFMAANRAAASQAAKAAEKESMKNTELASVEAVPAVSFGFKNSGIISSSTPEGVTASNSTSFGGFTGSSGFSFGSTATQEIVPFKFGTSALTSAPASTPAFSLGVPSAPATDALGNKEATDVQNTDLSKKTDAKEDAVELKKSSLLGNAMTSSHSQYNEMAPPKFTFGAKNESNSNQQQDSLFKVAPSVHGEKQNEPFTFGLKSPSAWTNPPASSTSNGDSVKAQTVQGSFFNFGSSKGVDGSHAAQSMAFAPGTSSNALSFDQGNKAGTSSSGTNFIFGDPAKSHSEVQPLGTFGFGATNAGDTTPLFSGHSSDTLPAFGASANTVAGFGSGFGSGSSAGSVAFGSNFGGGFGSAQVSSFGGQGGGFGFSGGSQAGGQMGAPFGSSIGSGSAPFGGAGFGTGTVPTFGASVQQSPVQTIQNNPFGSGTGFGGSGFSVGTSGGNSQSEGRRKLRVKRAHRR